MIPFSADSPRVFSPVLPDAIQIHSPRPQRVAIPDWDRHERAEAVLKVSGAEIRHDQSESAFYRPATDRINLPARDSFKSANSYSATALPELWHWTCHISHLDRDRAHRFGSGRYANNALTVHLTAQATDNPPQQQQEAA